VIGWAGKRAVARYSAVIFFACVSTAFAQKYELGADFGYGLYRNGSIYSSSGSVQAGIRNRFAAGVILGFEFSRFVSAEFNYVYHDGHPFLQGMGVKADIQGQSQTLTPELLFHFKDGTHRWRPYLEGGAGAKGYIIAGPAPVPQPIPQIAALTTNDIWKVVFSVGGGVKYRIMDHFLARAGFLDYLTTFPRQQIVPAPNNTARGIFEQFTPTIGLSYTF
jgi:opacity protein-like surface antigen